jgi:hypothetical protein
MQHRQSLHQTKHDQAKSFDSGVLTLSSGALGLSVFLLDKLVQPHLPWTRWILAGSWVFFVLAIFSTLLSFFSSQAAHQTLIDEWDEIWRRQSAPEKPICNRYNRCTKCLNWLSASLFFIGVAMLAVFAMLNLVLEKNRG